MKRILSIMAVSVMALGMTQAQTNLNLFNFYDDPPASTINLEGDKGLVTTLGTGATAGYVAAYWWSADGVDYSVIGISGFADLLGGGPELDGCFYFDSEGIIPKPGSGSTTSYVGLTIFRYDAGVAAKWDGDQWNAFINGLTVDSLGGNANATTIEGYWNAAQSGTGQTGEWWGAQISIDYLGGVSPEDIFNGPGGFGWNSTKQYLTANPIPEPSTWLLLGAGAAFTVIMRRRRK